MVIQTGEWILTSMETPNLFVFFYKSYQQKTKYNKLSKDLSTLKEKNTKIIFAKGGRKEKGGGDLQFIKI